MGWGICLRSLGEGHGSNLLCFVGSRVYETCRNLMDTVDDINPALPIIRSIP